MKHRSLCLLAGLVVGAAAGWCRGEGQRQKGGPAKFTVYKKWPFDAAEAKRRQAETAKALGVNIEDNIDLGRGVRLTLVLIPAGEFMMGSPEDEPGRNTRETLHRVTITKPFWLGKYEVTQEQWRAVMGTSASAFKGAKNPVEKVSWENCQEFRKRLKARRPGDDWRLPTEAQWEYACRAGSATTYCFGGDAARLARYAWFQSNSLRKAHGVGQKQANAWGLRDMHGNVWEWCQDWYGPYGTGDQSDPTGPASGEYRVLRGGSWSQSASFCRSATRFHLPPGRRFTDIGFRVARPLS